MWLTLFQDRARAASTTCSVFGNSGNTSLLLATVAAAPATTQENIDPYFIKILSINNTLHCCIALRCAVLCCAVLCCAVLCCAVLCCAVLCCAVLCCGVVWCGVVWCVCVCVCVRARASERASE